MNKRLLLALKQIVLILGVSMFLVGGVQAEAEMAPNFTLKSRDGKNIKLSELRGQIVLVNFWASWCGPCRQEMPILEKLYKKYKSLGFVIIGVNVDDKPKQAESLLKLIDVSFPIVFDTDKKVSEKYKVTAMPSSFFIDRDGKMRSEHKGYLPEYEKLYKHEIKKLIRE
ncbi:Thioredoxin family protein [hydrothermal vent metagenome]|uniref:Thioredoxin family protein n=1 Tax=hydrothermal vent metagenome TaxID=652676 RepID=A0A3B1B9M0_9ZZZZ